MICRLNPQAHNEPYTSHNHGRPSFAFHLRGEVRKKRKKKKNSTHRAQHKTKKKTQMRHQLYVINQPNAVSACSNLYTPLERFFLSNPTIHNTKKSKRIGTQYIYICDNFLCYHVCMYHFALFSVCGGDVAINKTRMYHYRVKTLKTNNMAPRAEGVGRCMYVYCLVKESKRNLILRQIPA